MSLRGTLLQSVAALDRIAPEPRPSLESQAVPSRYNERTSFDTYHPSLGPQPRYASSDENEKFIRLSNDADAFVRHQHRFRNSHCLPEVDYPFSDMEGVNSMDEPKLTLRYVVAMSVEAICVFFMVCIPAIGVSILGLAADNIAFGLSAPTVVVKTMVRGINYFDYWWTKMYYLPISYDPSTFAGLIVAGAIATICGTAAGILSAIRWHSADRVKLGRKRAPSNRTLVFSRLLVEGFMFATSLVVLICVRSLYHAESYNVDDEYDGKYNVRPINFRPALPAPFHTRNETYTRELSDDIPRYYIPTGKPSINPMNWNCRIQSHIDSESPMSWRYRQLCQEGNAARWMLVVLVLLQAVILVRHVVDYRKGLWRGTVIPWTRQATESRERIVSEDVGEVA